MIHCCFRLYFTVLFLAVFLGSPISAHTEPLDVQALQSLYKSFNNPIQLHGWRSDGGDPCEESWAGVACIGSSVIDINLYGLNLTGSLGYELSNLRSLKQLDVSSNNISGDIPYSLPWNLTHLNLACNNFSQNIPYSLSLMKNLRHMNLSHNSLSGPIGDVFTDLKYLREMDLSYNNFTGDLPISFATLKNLTKLFLQVNKFTGSVIFLADLHLTDLNIQENNFSGIIPRQFQSIQNLWFGSNRFDKAANNPPWVFPMDTIPNEQNITRPPSTESSAIENYHSKQAAKGKKKVVGPGGIALTVGGAVFVATCAALFFVTRSRRNRAKTLRRLESYKSSQHSLPISTTRECSYTAPEDSPGSSSARSPPLIASSQLPAIRTKVLRVTRRRSSAKKCKIPMSAKLYTLSEIQAATNSFNASNLLGEGSLGSVYKAEFPEGQICVVKNINTVALSFHEEEQFLDVVWNASCLRHPNIVNLTGYCIEHGKHIIVYEYIRNLSLNDVLHGEVHMPLSWALRLGIALAVSRALTYLHSMCKPPMAHSNLKATNILLDNDLVPHISDCGLAVLKPLTSNSVKLKASEMAICDSGYVAPEHVQPGTDNIKGDIYAFGVLLLELLTGRKPYDSLRPTEEQSLVKWASLKLHDNESLQQMVDPCIRGTIPPRSLSRFADIVSLCVQPEKEFRPPMSEIVESLTYIIQEQHEARGHPAYGTEVDSFDRSFRSTNSCFFASPTKSYLSI